MQIHHIIHPQYEFRMNALITRKQIVNWIDSTK